MPTKRKNSVRKAVTERKKATLKAKQTKMLETAAQ